MILDAFKRPTTLSRTLIILDMLPTSPFEFQTHLQLNRRKHSTRTRSHQATQYPPWVSQVSPSYPLTRIPFCPARSRLMKSKYSLEPSTPNWPSVPSKKSTCSSPQSLPGSGPPRQAPPAHSREPELCCCAPWWACS
jgi:hypothetical protein